MDKLLCINDDCHREFGGKVNYCPYCGTAQIEVDQADNVPVVEPADPEKAEPPVTEKQPNRVDVVNTRKIREREEKPRAETSQSQKSSFTPDKTDTTTTSNIKAEETLAQPAKESDKTPSKKKSGFFKKVIHFFFWLALGYALQGFFSDSDSDEKMSSVRVSSTSAPATDKPSRSDSLSLFIYTEPSNAKVRVMNIKETYKNGISLKPGRYDIEVSAPGFKTQRRFVELSPQQSRFSFILGRASKVSVANLPKGGYAIDTKGQRLRLPLAVDSSELEFYLTAPGYQQKFYSVKAGKDTTVRANLEPVRCNITDREIKSLGAEYEITVDLGTLPKQRVIDGFHDFWKSQGITTQLSTDGVIAKRAIKNKKSAMGYSVYVFERNGRTYVDFMSKLFDYVPVIETVDRTFEENIFCNILKTI
ncbi:PEGA domain-containing protein [Endozoicomonas sp. SESOKO1]|uniref:PEGA domain-containing protein n=1 Tax=Endozoicomonas sp. SESOKO1 TaxID=2828742 RepID=UPI0021475B83|nr:PEGA domain-containing protein [Endozoicomonas sp. SESOKO1]